MNPEDSKKDRTPVCLSIGSHEVSTWIPSTEVLVVLSNFNLKSFLKDCNRTPSLSVSLVLSGVRGPGPSPAYWTHSDHRLTHQLPSLSRLLPKTEIPFLRNIVST